MIKIKNITLKNFLSVGAVTQSVIFQNRGLTLILGENLDLGGNGARNGVGKSTILQALSYALFDSPITNIKKDNLINKTNSKNMLVSVDYEIGSNKYKIERGRKPNVFKYFVNGVEKSEDEAQGENRKTQAEVEKALCLSNELFKHIVALSTYTQPFLLLKQNEQRPIIEELLGITQLSEKAEILKRQIKDTKDLIKEEEIKIKTLLSSNEGIQKTINQLKLKSKKFLVDKENNLISIAKSIEDLEHIDIDVEIQKHKELKEYLEKETNLKFFKKQLKIYKGNFESLEEQIIKTSDELESALDNKCPTCGQDVHDDKHEILIANLKEKLVSLSDQVDAPKDGYERYLSKIEAIGDLDDKPTTFYNNLDDAYNHRQNLLQLQKDIENENNQSDPYQDQVISLEKDALQEIHYDVVNDLKLYLEHQEFLYKLLTSKDSFLRKKIIDQNLSYLNVRLNYYLSKMGLLHSVEFKNDLSVEITYLGQEFDFGQLSRGQQNRLILALSWAFRDVWESINHPINLLFIDEMIDSGIDTMGAENTLEILKKLARERLKDIFLISHKEELINRVSNVLMVIMENGFTTYNADEIE